MFGKGYELICAGVIAAVLAQIIKFVGHLIIKREVNFQVLFTTGGMPSSHSAGVCAMGTTAGLIKGFDSIEFAIVVGYALVVMYDAAGLRRAAGKMATSLNKMMDDYYKHKKMDTHERLKELLGHTPFEVFVGALWGILVSWCIHYLPVIL